MDLANISLPSGEPTPIDGTSFAHALDGFAENTGGVSAITADIPRKSAAVSQYPRCPQDTTRLWRANWCEKVDANAFGWMG